MIARVVVDSPLPHLDRPFDYAVPDALAGLKAGTRVRVPFAGRLTSALVVEVTDEPSPRATKAIKSAGALPSLSQEGLELARAIAARYGGGLWDVVRLMAPARAASVEKLDWAGMTRAALPEPPDAPELLPHAPGQRGVWACAPSAPVGLPADQLVAAAAASVARGGSAILVAPDARAVAALVAAAARSGLTRWTARSGGHVAVLDADDGPSVRYGSYLAAMRGVAPLVIGTRQAAWQPVPDLRLIAVWDEASGTLQEPRAPYPHARTVAAMRAQVGDAALLVAGHALSADAAALVSHGFARAVDAAPERAALPTIEVVGDERREREGGSGRHWMPSAVWGPLVAAAATDPVAILVPQAGYAAGLACARCGTWAECLACGGDLAASGPDAVPACVECGTQAPAWHCPECRGYRLRPVGLGADRLAEQVRRMAAGVSVTASSSSAGVKADGEVADGIVVATPGALPAVDGGYARLAIVGARVGLGEGLGAETAVLRRWLNAASLVRGRALGGAVSVVGDVPDGVRRALAAWDGATLAEEDLAQRAALGLPPHRRSLRLDGPADAIAAAREAWAPLEADVSPDAEGAWVLASRAHMQGVVDAVRAVVVDRSARSLAPLYLRVDAAPGAR